MFKNSLDDNQRENANQLCESVLKVTGIDVKTKTKKRSVVEARAIAYNILRENLKLSYQQIGTFFNKNHATVIHSLNELPYMVKFNKQLENIYLDILLDWMGGDKKIFFNDPKIECEFLRNQNMLLNLEIKRLKQRLSKYEITRVQV